MDEIKSKVRGFLAKFFRNQELGDDDDIFAQGFVSSLFAMQLVMFVEREFQVRIANKDLDLNNFRTVSAIAELVRSKVDVGAEHGSQGR